MTSRDATAAKSLMITQLCSAADVARRGYTTSSAKTSKPTKCPNRRFIITFIQITRVLSCIRLKHLKTFKHSVPTAMKTQSLYDDQLINAAEIKKKQLYILRIIRNSYIHSFGKMQSCYTLCLTALKRPFSFYGFC
jgi:hypothetical protein